MEKLALVAASIVDSDRQFARQQLVANGGNDARHLPPEGRREQHFDAASRPSVPDAPDRYVHIQHFFEAQRLRADLEVGSQTVSCAGLVLHRADLLPLDLNDIGSAGQTQRLGPKRDPAEDALAALGAMSTAVDTSMRTRTADGMRVVAPHSIAVDEGALSRTVRKVLDRGDRHHGFGGHRLSAPIARVVSAVARRS